MANVFDKYNFGTQSNNYNNRQRKQEETGYLDALMRGGKANLQGVAGGLGHLFGAEQFANDMQRNAQENARKREHDTVFSLDYITDPEGLAYDVGGNLGSMVALAPFAMAVPAGVATAGAGAIGAGLGRLGLSKGAQWAVSEAGKKALTTGIRGAGAGVGESLAEWGSTAQEAQAQGVENPRLDTMGVFGQNLLVNPISSGLEYMLLGGKLFNPTAKAGETFATRALKAPMRALPAGGANAIQNGIEELTQQTISDNALGLPVGDIYNPSTWTDSQRQAFEVGFASGGALAGVSSTGRALMPDIEGEKALKEQRAQEGAKQEAIAEQNKNIDEYIDELDNPKRDYTNEYLADLENKQGQQVYIPKRAEEPVVEQGLGELPKQPAVTATDEVKDKIRNMPALSNAQLAEQQREQLANVQNVSDKLIAENNFIEAEQAKAIRQLEQQTGKPVNIEEVVKQDIPQKAINDDRIADVVEKAVQGDTKALQQFNNWSASVRLAMLSKYLNTGESTLSNAIANAQPKSVEQPAMLTPNGAKTFKASDRAKRFIEANQAFQNAPQTATVSAQQEQTATPNQNVANRVEKENKKLQIMQDAYKLFGQGMPLGQVKQQLMSKYVNNKEGITQEKIDKFINFSYRLSNVTGEPVNYGEMSTEFSNEGFGKFKQLADKIKQLREKVSKVKESLAKQHKEIAKTKTKEELEAQIKQAEAKANTYISSDMIDDEYYDRLRKKEEGEKELQQLKQERQQLASENYFYPTFTINDKQNGIEIKFGEKPDEDFRKQMKDAGFRWSTPKQLWWAKQNDKSMQFAESIGYKAEQKPVEQVNKPAEIKVAETAQKPVEEVVEKAEVKAEPKQATAKTFKDEPEKLLNFDRINKLTTSEMKMISDMFNKDKKQEDVVESKQEPKQTGSAEKGEIENGETDIRGTSTRDNSKPVGERPDTDGRNTRGSVQTPQRKRNVSDGTGERGVYGEIEEPDVLTPAQKKNAKPSEVAGHNFTITDEDNIGDGGEKTKYRNNVEAIKLLKQLEAENRLATPSEQKVLAKYVGWGGLSSVFSYGRIDPKWEAEAKEIKELLTEQEYRDARSSTTSAFYTPIDVVKAIWGAVERLGFKGGRVLEPSMGVGNFFGVMPEAMRSKSALNGVELDSISGRIAKQLYQKANIEVTGYETTQYPDNFFDLAISNVPFVSGLKPHDPKYDKYKLDIHNYFFAKSIDKVRNGGLICFITATSTMQGSGDNARIRELLKTKADLVGAVRLPTGTFKGNAGTNVDADLIILQKREPNTEPSKFSKEWLNLVNGEAEGRYGIRNVKFNEYYENNAEMVIGEWKIGDGYYDMLVADGKGLDVAKELESRIELLPKNIYKPLTGKRNLNSIESAKTTFLAPSDARVNAYIVKDGKAFQNIDGNMVELDSKEQKKAVDYVGLRDVVKKILSAQITPETTDAVLEDMRAELNKTYDSFVKKYGYVNDVKNVKSLSLDPEFGIVSSIENYKFDKKTKKAEAKKNDIFTKRTVNAVVEITSADNVSDALALSLANTGAVNIDYIAKLMGKKPAEAVKSLEGLVYQNPVTMAYETADEYLSGNVREKLEYAKQVAKQNKDFAKNVKALEKVQPKDLTPEEITVALGTPWIPASDIEAFAKHMVGGGYYNPIEVKFTPVLGKWTVSWADNYGAESAKRGVNSISKWGTYRIPFNEILDYALNQKSPIVYDTHTDGRKTINQAETAIAQQKVREVQEEFKKWIWQDKERTERLVNFYNNNFNNWRLREYDGSHLAMQGYSAVEPPLKPHQKNAIWRIMQNMNTLIAHCVGAGKTWTMQASAMEMKRLGIAKKSMFVIPNHMLKQFENEFRRIYPNAKLLTVSSETLPDVVTKQTKLSKKEIEALEKEKGRKLTDKELQKATDDKNKSVRAERTAMRQRVLSQIATEDWDSIIISHNMFKRIPMSKEATKQFIQEQIDEMRSAIIELSSANDKSGKRLVKELEKKASAKEAELKEAINEEGKDIVIPFEQLGIDQIFVDEADLFKNLGFVTKMNRIAGLSTTNSQRSTDMFMKTQYITKTNGGRGVVFATGTPISNTMAEMFTMLRYLDMQGLKDKNMSFFDNWASNFAVHEPTVERSPDGNGYRQTEKFTSFMNMPELIKMFRKVADVKTQQELDLDIPKLKNGKPTVVEIETNDSLSNYIKNTIVERANKIKNRQVDPSIDNMLKLTGDLRKASLDMRLIDPTVPEAVAGGKIKAVADNIFAKWKESSDSLGAQLVFCDLSTPKGVDDKKVAKEGEVEETGEELYEAEESEKINVYSEIKKRLIKQGVPENQIAFIHDAKNKNQKEELFEKVRSGEVRVLIGSTEKMGAGTNIQDRLVALHHVDAPWRPRDIEQREGRILRQGNKNEEVEIFNYVTKDSFDANMWEKLKNKATMINQAMSDNLANRVIEDADANVLNFAEVEALASGNPLMAERVMVNAELNKYAILYGNYLEQLYENQRKALQLPSVITQAEIVEKQAKADIKKRVDITGDNFNLLLGKRNIGKRADAKEALEATVRNYKNEVGGIVGQIGGFDLRLRYVKSGNTFTRNGKTYPANEDTVIAELVGNNVYGCEPTLASIEHAVMNNPDKALDNAVRTQESLKKELKSLEAEIARPFEYEDKYQKLKQRSAEIDKELGIGNDIEVVEEVEDTTKFRPLDNPAYQRSLEEIYDDLNDIFEGAKVEELGNEEWRVTTPNGKRIIVKVADRIILNDKQSANMRKAHNLDSDYIAEASGYWRAIGENDVDGELVISRNSKKGTAYHEILHAVMDLALTNKEKQALIKDAMKEAKATGKDVEEVIAERYRKWVLARKKGQGTAFGKLFKKMQDFYYKLKKLFTGMENAHNIMRKIESGEVWERNGNANIKTSSQKYSEAPTKNNLNSIVISTEPSSLSKTIKEQGVKGWLQDKAKNFYRDWVDKNDALHDYDNAIEKATGKKLTDGEKIYNKAQMMNATATGMANALIEGDEQHIKSLSKRLGRELHNVTLKKILDFINNDKMNKLFPNYLKENGYKDWVDAFGHYLAFRRLREMKRLYGDEYKLPKGVTIQDIEKAIQNAPAPFKKASDDYYKLNDNMLIILEDAGIISKEVHKLLNDKYKEYCPLMRDFSDTAGADMFLQGLSNGGRGIANVSSTLKRISLEGSERGVINPLETTFKAVAVMANRSERNKVGQLAVSYAKMQGMEDIIRHIPTPKGGNAVADPKNSIFTVMIDGKKEAYQVIPELYSPIVGYNVPTAGFVLGVARDTARMLRTGATISPSFIIRNFIRDTIFASISSQNGFVPIVDSVKGAYALLHDAELKADFEVAGVTAFNFYKNAETAYKSLVELNGGKEINFYNPIDVIKALAKYPEEFSAFVESATRMGEFKRAREAGKSIDEATRDARELTIDFSRSGVLGENVNLVVPFFNATIQGGDKLYRLFRDNPVGTAVNVAKYIVLPSMVLWAMNYDDEEYKELDPKIKMTHWIIGDVRIPKPQEAGILFGSGIEAMLDLAMGNDPEAMKHWAKQVVDGVSPNIIPTVILPLIEWQANYSFFRDGKLVGYREERLPDELQYKDSTSELSKDLGKLTGLSPIKLDNTVRGYTGTMGMLLWQAYDIGSMDKAKLPEKKITELPLVRDFFVNDYNTRRSVDDFYKLAEQADKQHAGYGVKGKPTAVVQGIRRAKQQISNINKDIRNITASNLTPSEKRERIDKKREIMHRIAKQANNRYGKFFE